MTTLAAPYRISIGRALGWLLLLAPATAWAQTPAAAITGIVRDESGGVLPGVTVEASSPALIEKVRSVVTDGEGRYRIIDLRPGSYAVAFSLTGFRTYRREALELTTGFTATVNADMAVGALEETVTVTGEAPVVDTQNIRQQTQFARETLESLPGTGRLTILSQVIPGAVGTAANYSVGGLSDRAQTDFSVHGAPNADPVVDGMNQTVQSLTLGVYVFNQLTFQEVVVETSGMSAERDTGGMQINIVPRDGGNRFSGGASFSYSGPRLESNNITDELIARNLPRHLVGSLKQYYDAGGVLGGPIKRDKLWFFTAARSGVLQQFQQGNYFNALQSNYNLRYEPDLSRPAHTDDYSRDYTLRLTWQAATKHKFVFANSVQPNCTCFQFLLNPQGGILAAPEATGQHHYNPQYLANGSWTYPATDRVLFEAGAAALINTNTSKRQPGVGNTEIQVIEQVVNLRYGSRANQLGNVGGSYTVVPRKNLQQRFAMSYVTGSHHFKAGANFRYFSTGDISRNQDPNQINQARDYTFRGGVPQSVRIWAVPFAWEEAGRDLGLFVQDQWTLGRTTLNLGLRYNDAQAWTPDQVLPPGPFVPERTYEAKHGVPHWRNLNPRVGIAHDLSGTGTTAVKVSIGRFNPAVRTAAENPSLNQTHSTTRTWNDTNQNLVPDCDLRNPVGNGECGPWSDSRFGQPRAVTTRNAPDALEGFNLQEFHWQGSASIQHQLRPGIGLNVGYYRTWYGGFQVTDNLEVTPADFDEFCITAPADPRLPTSGQQLCGLFDIRPAKFGLVDNLITQASNYGDRSRVYNGVDMTLNARFGRGGQLSGGLAIGRMMEDLCLVVDSPQDARPGFCEVSPPWSAATQVKFLAVYPLPWDLQTSVIYQNAAGVPTGATYVATNAEIAPSLGRNLAACGNRLPCNATVTLDLTPPQTMYEERLQQVDLRMSRTFRLRGARLRANFDIHNISNAGNVLNLNRRYGPAWLDVVQVMGGRLMKLSAQLDF